MTTCIQPEEAQSLMAEGWTYLDVRSEAEFEAGHPVGAYNIPLLHLGASGMVPNASFLAQVEAAFPKDTKLVLGCKSGGRSARAAAMLLQAGFEHVVDQGAGFIGKTDPFGRVTEQGWQPRGLPVSTEALPGRSYSELCKA